MGKRKVHLCEELFDDTNGSYLTLKQNIFPDVDIDNSEGDWVAWVESETQDDPDFTNYTSLTGSYETSQGCFDSVVFHYDENKKTPKGLKNKDVKIYNFILQLQIQKIDNVFNWFWKTKPDLQQLLLKFKAQHVNFDYLLDYFSEYDQHTVDYDFGDSSSIKDELEHISDRWKCHHRVAFLKEFCSHDSFKG